MKVNSTMVKGKIAKRPAVILRFCVYDEDLFRDYVPVLGTECEKQQYGEQQLALLYMHMFWYKENGHNSCFHMCSDPYDEKEIWLYLSDPNEIQQTITEFTSRFPICKCEEIMNCHSYAMQCDDFTDVNDVAVGGDYIYNWYEQLEADLNTNN